MFITLYPTSQFYTLRYNTFQIKVVNINEMHILKFFMTSHSMYSSGKIGAMSDGNRPKANSADLRLDPTTTNLIKNRSVVLKMKHEDRLTQSFHWEFLLRSLHKVRIKMFMLQNNHLTQRKEINRPTLKWFVTPCATRDDTEFPQGRRRQRESVV
jgi:hypothetical protein